MEAYEVVRQLGKGGMGTAYCVRPKAGSSGFLALKQVACQSTAEGNDALREAKMLQSLSHHNIVRYHDVFLHMDGGLLQVCTVMEFCRSGDLAAHLSEARSGGETVDERRGARWMFQVCDALAYLHARRVVHRDLKPANVFLHLISRSDMALKIGDFGLSATLEAGKRTSRVGTPCYLAPEILFNEAYGERVDIWGAGCIFYELMTLDFLWERRGMLGMTVQSEPVTPASLPARLSPDLRSIIAACLAYKGARRPSAAQLCEGLRGLQQGKRFDYAPEPAGDGSDQDWAAPLINLLNPFSDSIQSGMTQSLNHLAIGSMFSSANAVEGAGAGAKTRGAHASSAGDAEGASEPSKPYDRYGYASNRDVDREIAQAEQASRISSSRSVAKELASSSSSSSGGAARRAASSSQKFSHIEASSRGVKGAGVEVPPGSVPGSARELPSRSKKWLARMQEVEKGAQSKHGSGQVMHSLGLSNSNKQYIFRVEGLGVRAATTSVS